MQHFIDDIRLAVRNKTWYTALCSSLVLPDICGSIENPSSGSQLRYSTWFDREVGKQYYVSQRDGSNEQFLFGRDCYALRCAFLHQGEFDVSDQRAKIALEKFQFTVPPDGWEVHNNKIGNALQLQVSCFCEDICFGVESWMERINRDPVMSKRISELARISIHKAGMPFFL